MPNTEKVAVILAGGKGTRLSVLISDVPKPLASIAGEPFIFLILRHLKSLGITRVFLLTGYMHEKILATCNDGKQFGLDIVYSREKTPLGTAGALKNAESYLKNYSDFLVLNGDTYLECSLKEFLLFPLTNAIGLIGAMTPVDVQRFGSLEVDEHQFIKDFREKDHQSTGLVNAGIYRLSTKILNEIPKNKFMSLETDVFPDLIKKNLPLKAFALEGEFVDIGVPESYNAFNNRMIEIKEAVDNAID